MFNEQTLTNNVCIDPSRQARLKEGLKGSIPLKDLNLPPEVLPNQSTLVSYEIDFDIDPENYVFLRGKTYCVMQLQCQRCMQPIEFTIDSEFCLSPVQDSQQASHLPERYEAIQLEQNQLSVQHLLEEELLLNFPLAPMHERCAGVQ